MIEAPRGAIWAAGAFATALDIVGRAVEFLAEKFSSTPTSPDECKTPQELRNYAYSIQHAQPSTAQDLIAAANRAEARE